MHQHEGGFAVQKRLMAYPRQQLITVRRGKYGLQRIFRANRGKAFRHGEQEQIVIAQHNLRGGSELFEIAKDTKGVRAAIDQIADTPEAV